MRIKVFVSVLFAGILSFFSQQGPAFGEMLTIAGTGDSQELLRALAEKFKESHPQVHVMVPDSVGSGGGIRAVLRGKSDFARVARPLTEEERGRNLQYALFARSPVVFVVHPSVTGVTNLSFSQIVSIYSGKIGNWRQLGGEDKKLYVVNREVGDSSRTILEQEIPGFGDIKSFAGKVFYTTPAARETLIKYPDTIGYLPMAMVKDTNLHIISIEHVMPTTAAVASGAYPLVVPFALVWKGTLTDTAQKFLNFLSEPAGRNVIANFSLALP